MKKIACLALTLAAMGRSFATEATPVITDRQVSVVGFVDAGQIVQGTLTYDEGGSPTSLDHLFLNRDGIALTYSGTLNGKSHMTIGVGGLFWKPVAAGVESPGDRRIQFGPGISEASFRYDFSGRLNLKFGFFGYKYNPDAINLGEYLLRSEAYPTIVYTAGTGGWVWLNSNEYKSMGAKLSWDLLDGTLRHDFLLFSEFNYQPFFDFSPSYVATFKIANLAEVGAGVSLHRWLPIRPSATTTHVTLPNDTTRVELTFKAIKVMARGSLNLGEFMGWSEKSSGPFKIFAEAAILGVENQDAYYTDLMDRVPIMVGTDVPTFGVLDLLSLQLEYLRNPYPDNNYEQTIQSKPQPVDPGTKVYDQDDLKWSLSAQKNLFTGLDLIVQVANDHFRTQDLNAQTSTMPLTQKPSDWYYLLRFQWAM